MKGRILAVDPGDKRIGLAISDETGTIASPLRVINHVARNLDAALVASIAAEQGAVRVIIGQALDDEGHEGPAARKARRFAEALQAQTELPVELWDESGSTAEARQARQALGVRRSRRSGHMDDLAAVVILQTYLDSKI